MTAQRKTMVVKIGSSTLVGTTAVSAVISSLTWRGRRAPCAIWDGISW